MTETLALGTKLGAGEIVAAALLVKMLLQSVAAYLLPLPHELLPPGAQKCPSMPLDVHVMKQNSMPQFLQDKGNNSSFKVL